MRPNAFDKTPWYKQVLGLFLRFDIPTILIVLFLAALGLLAMYSAGYDRGDRFPQHAQNMVLAAIILFAVAQVPPRRIMSFAVPVYLVAVLLLIGVALVGTTRNGSQRWLNIGIVIQPSEIMKLAMPMILAWWFHIRAGQLKWPDFIVAGVLLLVPAALIMHQPDLGTTLLVLSAGLSVIFFAGLSWKLVLPPVIILVILVVLLVAYEPKLCAPDTQWLFLHDYQKNRVCTLLDPYRDPLGKGFHIIQGMIAIGSGGVWGKGFMSGTQTHLEFIPERTTDFIFAAWSEEFGLIGNIGLFVGFLLLIWRSLYIAAQAKTISNRLLAAAIGVMFFIYAFVNMGMVMGIVPVVGVPLPFISYGGTAMVTLGLSLGFLMSVARDRPVVEPPLPFSNNVVPKSTAE